MRRLAYYWPLFALVLYYSVFFLQRISFITADLGRHLTNGRVILETRSVFATNFYSYTAPQFPTINHHWLFGVLAYLVQQTMGFGGLTVLNVSLATAAVLLMLLIAAQRSGRLATLVSGAVVLPIIVYRADVRPEMISFFLTALFFFTLENFRRSTTQADAKKTLLTTARQPAFMRLALNLAILQVIWTNTHLFFIFGPLLVGYFWLKSVLQGSGDQRLLFVLLCVTWLSTLCNPAGIIGALEPFRIFDQYGYQVAENQTIDFMIRRTGAPFFWYAAVLIPAALAAFVLRMAQLIRAQGLQVIRHTTADLLLLISFALVGWRVHRTISFFGLLALPFLAQALKPSLQWSLARARALFASTLGLSLSSLAVFVLLVLLLGSQLFTPKLHRLGLGLMPGSNKSVEFFKEQGLHGPIFNNYDNGGYLIYHLFPLERIFVDNRPEAYPATFFTDAYIPAQESEEEWHKLDEQYHFNVIFFYRHDATSWAQPFLARRLADEDWAPVFVDDYALILLKNSKENQPLITQFEIPRDRFNLAP